MSNTFDVHEVQRQGRTIEAILRPTSLREALIALRSDPSRHAIAGGTDLLVEYARSGEPGAETLVDLTTVVGFGEVAEEENHFRLGGGVTHARVVRDPRVVTFALPLAQACAEVGSPQLRNRATVAGNLATASPANDTISALMALGATVELSSCDGDEIVVRRLAVSEFFTGFRETALAPGELISAIDVPKLGPAQRGIWFKVGLRKNQAISVVHGAMVVSFEDGCVAEASLALGSVAPTVILIDDFPDSLVGSELVDETIDAAAQRVARVVEPISDRRGTAEYRSSVVETVVRRSLRALRANDAGSSWGSPPTLSVGRTDRPSPIRDVVDDSSHIAVSVNGEVRRGSRAASQTLLHWLRDQTTATTSTWGTKEGCAEGECGACTVNLDGSAVMSCLVPAAQADGGTVVTIEGLKESEVLHPVQAAFVDEFAVQCGYCIPGFVVAVERLLVEVPEPTDEQIAAALGGNLCRCTGYYSIMEAVRSASRRMDGASS